MNPIEPEIWKMVNAHPKYEVSNLGNIRKVATKRPLKQRIAAGDKYLSVSFGKGIAARTIVKRVHRIVCIAFHKRIKGKNHVNHLDGDKLNNRASNLAWSTQQENNDHSYHVLGNKSPMLSDGHIPPNKRWDDEMQETAIRLFKEGKSTNEIGDIVKLNGSSVRKNLRKHFKSPLKKVSKNAA